MIHTETAPAKKEFGTQLTKVNDTFMPLILSQMQKNNIEMSPYAKTCVLHAISAINSALDKAGISWNSAELDKSTVSDILIKVACFQLNAAASPREVYFQTRNVKGADANWKKQIEMGIEGDGNDALLARFGRDVVEVGQFWKVREKDDFTYPTFNGLDMDPPKWTPKGGGKIVRVVYPIIKSSKDGKRHVEFYISEREDVIKNLIAHINSNMMNETFGFAESKRKATNDQKIKIEARKRELLKRANDLGLDAALDDPELQPWISPAWTEFHSRESMIERKMRNNAIKKIPKDFGNGALETMFEEATDDVYRSTAREIRDNANRDVIDVQVDKNTGEVVNPEALPERTPQPSPEPQQPEAEPAAEQAEASGALDPEEFEPGF